jgi:hypothetical protein
VPRHITRLITRIVAWLVGDYSASRTLIVDYPTSRRLVVDYSASHRLVIKNFASRRLVIDYFASAARLGASARCVAHHAARRGACL